MQVTATERGYHGKLRESGDVFDVPTGSKAKWFAPVDTDVVREGKRSKKSSKTDANEAADASEDLT
ncbi:MAG TPA: hypothetical protein VF285_03085 [Castellaniella sp.]|uniref:hypothetical protein n=1 Tax=Castellaniella sp. TaxID=1955812 RepID=UPI002EDC172E